MRCPAGHELHGRATYCHDCGAYVDDLVGGAPNGGRVTTPKADTRSEKEIEHAIDGLMESLGCVVVRFSQPRASKQTPGIPDRLYLDERTGRWTWAEIKRATGKTTEAQDEMHRRFRACGIPVEVWRHEDDAMAWHEQRRAA